MKKYFFLSWCQRHESYFIQNEQFRPVGIFEYLFKIPCNICFFEIFNEFYYRIKLNRYSLLQGNLVQCNTQMRLADTRRPDEDDISPAVTQSRVISSLMTPGFRGGGGTYQSPAIVAWKGKCASICASLMRLASPL